MEETLSRELQGDALEVSACSCGVRGMQLRCTRGCIGCEYSTIAYIPNMRSSTYDTTDQTQRGFMHCTPPTDSWVLSTIHLTGTSREGRDLSGPDRGSVRQDDVVEEEGDRERGGRAQEEEVSAMYEQAEEEFRCILPTTWCKLAAKVKTTRGGNGEGGYGVEGRSRKKQEE